MKILISGGHLTPALAMIEYIQAQARDQVVFVGRKYAQKSTQQLSHEEREVTAKNVKFIAFDSGKLNSWLPWNLIPQLIGVVRAVGRANEIIKMENPSVFLSFGGYLAVPLALAAWRQQVPIVTHEQTRTLGVANRFIQLFAKMTAISFSELLVKGSKKIILTGNPVRPKVLEVAEERPSWITFDETLPVLYITGGSQGSQRINEVVVEALPELLKTWNVVHQCGGSKGTAEYERLERVKEKISPEFQGRYIIMGWMSETELSWLYGHAEAIISRAGANTVQELSCVGRPALFIPIPNTHGDEQVKNAREVEKEGAAMVLLQEDLNGESLLKCLGEFQARVGELRAAAQRRRQACILNADERLYDAVVQAAHPH